MLAFFNKLYYFFRRLYFNNATDAFPLLEDLILTKNFFLYIWYPLKLLSIVITPRLILSVWWLRVSFFSVNDFFNIVIWKKINLWWLGSGSALLIISFFIWWFSTLVFA